MAAPAVVAGVAFTTYVRTLMPGVSFGDWAEAQTVPHVLGIGHPNGFPTYTLVAWVLELVPIGSIAFRANLLSAVFVAGALATLAVIVGRLGVRPLIAVAAALALGAVGTVWAAATVARVDPLQLLLMALLAHRALVWADERRPRDLLIGALLVGLALGNHLLTLVVAPFLVLLALWAGRYYLRQRPVLLLAAIGAGLLGLSIYVYVPLAASASPPLTYNHPTSLEGVLWLATGAQFRGQFAFLSAAGPGEFVDSIPALWDLAVSRATPVVPVLGMTGLVLLLFTRPAVGLAFAAIFLTGIYVWANYYVKLEHYLLVPFLMLAIGLGIALERTARALAWLGRRAGRLRPASRLRPPNGLRLSSLAGVTVGLAGLAFAGVLAALNWAESDRSQDRSGPDYVDAVLGALPQDAAFISYWDPSTPLWYARFVEGRRPDVLILDDSNMEYDGWGTVSRSIERLICDRPVFLMRIGEGDLAPLRAEYRLTQFLTVNVGSLSPSARVSQPIYRVEPVDSSTCAQSSAQP